MNIAAALTAATLATVAGDDLPQVTHGHVARAALEQALVRRIDLVGSGDSNQTFQLYGWSGGTMHALVDRGFPMYASGLMCQNQSSNSGYGFSMPLYAPFKTGERGARTGAPAPFESLGSPWDEDLETGPFENHSYCWAPADLVANGLGSFGMRLDPDADILDRSARLRFHLTLGRFAGNGDGQLVMQWLDDTAETELAVRTILTEGAKSDALVTETLDLPAAPRTGEIWARQMRRTSATDWRGRVFTLYHRIENLDRPAGFSFHTWGDHPTRSARHLGNLLINDETVTDAYKHRYLAEVRRLQTGSPIVIHVINHGFNDRNEGGVPSVGPSAQAGHPLDSRTREGYKDNVQGIINQIRADHLASGGSLDGLFFILMPSHRLGDAMSESALLIEYRYACDELARENAHTTFVNLAALISALQMFQLGYYAEGGWYSPHLSTEGYDALAGLAIDAILNAEDCPGDVDLDGTVGLLDLLHVLMGWGPCTTGTACRADIDRSGDVGFLDLGQVLSTWGECP
jgi:hypothetical protein